MTLSTDLSAESELRREAANRQELARIRDNILHHTEKLNHWLRRERELLARTYGEQTCPKTD